MHARTILALAVALTTQGCFGLTYDIERELAATRWEAGETTTVEVARAAHDPETDALTFDVRDETTKKSERVEHHEEYRSWSVKYMSLTDHLWTETDDGAALLIATPITLAVDLVLPIVSLVVSPLRVAFGDSPGEWDTRTPEVKVEQQPWTPLELYDPTTGARAPAVNGTRAGDLALNGFRATELTAIGPDGAERPLALPASVGHVFSEAAAGWDRAPEERRVRVPLGASLADALRTAPEGAWLQLEAGDYPLESTVFLHGRRLTLAGRGAGATRVRARGVALWISGAADVTLRGLAVVLDGSTVSDAVRASGGRTVVVGCAFSGARFEEVPAPPPAPPAPGEAPRPPLGPSYRGGVGLHLDGDGSTEVRSSAFTGGGTIGILVTDSHRLRVTGSRFEGFKLEGVSFRGASTDNLVSSCTIRGPGHGVGVLVKSRARVQSSDIEVARAGILVDGEAAVEASRNRPHGCSSGVSVQGKATGTITDNDCEGNQAGILVETDGTLVTVSGNRCTSNRNNGITLQGKSRVDVHGNTCRQNGGGILVTGTATGQVHGNTLERNENGISIQDSSAPSVRDNKLLSNTKVGVLVTDSATPHVRRNEIRENGAGIGVQGKAARPTIEDNDITSNRGPGIQVGAGLEPAIRSNRIKNNAGSGIYRDGAPLLAPNNVFEGNGDQRGY